MCKILFIARSSDEFCAYVAKHLASYWEKDIRVEVLFVESSENAIAATNLVLYDLWTSWIVSKGYSSDTEVILEYEPLVRNPDSEYRPRADICCNWAELATSEDVKSYLQGIDIGEVFDPQCYEHILLDISLTNEDKKLLMHGIDGFISSIWLYATLQPLVRGLSLYSAALVPDTIIANWGKIWHETYGTEAPEVITKVDEVIQ